MLFFILEVPSSLEFGIIYWGRKEIDRKGVVCGQSDFMFQVFCVQVLLMGIKLACSLYFFK